MPPFDFLPASSPPAATSFGSEALLFGGPAKPLTTPQPGLFGMPFGGTGRSSGALFSDVVIKVVVGSDDLRRTFTVHEVVLSKRLSNLAEHTEVVADGTLKLPEVDPEVFDLYLQHLYTQHLPSKPDASDVGLNDHVHEIGLLCRFVSLAGTMRDDTAAKDAINAIYSKAHELPLERHPLFPSSVGVDIIYKATDGSCGAKKLMVDLHV
ncbi:hypothetical protein E8E11_000920 [Didymella keratinophila]|nr:hypothetical protein E8E11_000920 [Didymella keratinophila]